MKKSRTNSIPLVVESHPEEYQGYPFVTLIQYTKHHFLTLVDNSDEKMINAFVLDLCGPAGINEEHLIEIVTDWWDNRKELFPLSIEFSRCQILQDISPIFRGFNIEYVTRVIGPLPKFRMDEVHSVRRRKRKPIPSGMDIHIHSTSLKVGK